MYAKSYKIFWIQNFLGRIKFDPVKIRLFKNDEFDNGNDSEGSNVEDGNNLLSYE